MLSVINDNSSMYVGVLAEVIAPTTYAFAAKYGCPLIYNPIHPILNPDFFTPYFGDNLTLYEKVDRVLFSFYKKYFFNYQYYPVMDCLVKMYFKCSRA